MLPEFAQAHCMLSMRAFSGEPPIFCFSHNPGGLPAWENKKRHGFLGPSGPYAFVAFTRILPVGDFRVSTLGAD